MAFMERIEGTIHEHMIEIGGQVVVGNDHSPVSFGRDRFGCTETFEFMPAHAAVIALPHRIIDLMNQRWSIFAAFRADYVAGCNHYVIVRT